MRLFLFLLRASRSMVVLSVLAGVLAGASSTGLIGLINYTLTARNAAGPALIWAFAGLALIVLFSNLTSRILLIQLSQKAVYEMRMHLSRRILETPLGHLEAVGFHRLLAALTDDVMVISNALIAIPTLCINLVTVIVCLAYLGWLAKGVLLAAFAVIAVGVLSYQLLVVRAVHFLRQAREQQNQLFKHYRALTDGTKELKLNGGRRANFLGGVLDASARSFQRSNIRGLAFYATADSWGHFLFFLLIGLLLFALPVWKPVDAAMLTGYALTLLYILTPLEVVLSQLPIFGRAQVGLRQVESLGLSLDGARSEPTDRAGLAANQAFESLEFNSVTYTYRRETDETDFTLGPLDLRFERGEMVFLAGGNGSGKTTLAKLITGLYLPQGGEIRLNGEAVTEASLQHYREHFAAVFSDFYLFENLCGVEPPDGNEGQNGQARAQAYLTELELAHKVRIKDGTLSTVTALSQGQRKRLALLTAYLEDRPFYLFDEWAADQDPHFKEIFYTRLLPELKQRGKTILAITHDEKYFHVADRIVRLDSGKAATDERLRFGHAALSQPGVMAWSPSPSAAGD